MMNKIHSMSDLALLYDEVIDPIGLKHIYHITHVDNLFSIFFRQMLYAHGNPYQVRDISDNNVNDRRRRLDPIHHRPIHSYVPFYFNPKNSMLYKRKNEQDNIVILVMELQLALVEGSIFTDGNASSSSTKFFTDPWDLKKLDWDCILGNTWFDKEDCKRKRMAEVLVPTFVPTDEYLLKILCNTEETKKRVKKIMDMAVGPLPAGEKESTNCFYQGLFQIVYEVDGQRFKIFKKEYDCEVDRSFYFNSYNDENVNDSEDDFVNLLEKEFYEDLPF